MNILRKENEGVHFKRCHSPWVTLVEGGCLRGTTKIRQKGREVRKRRLGKQGPVFMSVSSGFLPSRCPQLQLSEHICARLCWAVGRPQSVDVALEASLVWRQSSGCISLLLSQVGA